MITAVKKGVVINCYTIFTDYIANNIIMYGPRKLNILGYISLMPKNLSVILTKKAKYYRAANAILGKLGKANNPCVTVN